MGIKREWLPEVKESVEVTGKITKEVAKFTGLREGTPIVAGAGDQAASAIGCGIIEEGLNSENLKKEVLEKIKDLWKEDRLDKLEV